MILVILCMNGMLLYFHLKWTLHNTDMHSKIYAKIFNVLIFFYLESGYIANKIIISKERKKINKNHTYTCTF